MTNRVYKIARRAEWRAASAAGVFAGSPDDLRDGFIHLSEERQLAGTLERHFSNEDDLVLIAFESSALGSELKWEPSRGGTLFPHFHGELPVSAALWERSLKRDTFGDFRLPAEWFVC